MPETNIILKGGKEEFELLEKATNYYNSILPKYWEIKENNTIDLILRHPLKKDGFFLPNKESYKIEDILEQVENVYNKNLKKGIDNTSPNHKEAYLSAYANYITKRDSKIVINSKKDIDMENMIGGSIREIASKSLTDKNYLNLFDDTTKNIIEMYISTNPKLKPMELTEEEKKALKIENNNSVNRDFELIKDSIGQEPILSPQMEKEVLQDIDKIKNNIIMNTNNQNQEQIQKAHDDVKNYLVNVVKTQKDKVELSNFKNVIEYLKNNGAFEREISAIQNFKNRNNIAELSTERVLEKIQDLKDQINQELLADNHETINGLKLAIENYQTQLDNREKGIPEARVTASFEDVPLAKVEQKVSDFIEENTQEWGLSDDFEKLKELQLEVFFKDINKDKEVNKEVNIDEFKENLINKINNAQVPKQEQTQKTHDEVLNLIDDILRSDKVHTAEELVNRYNSLNERQKDYFQKEGVREAISRIEEVFEEVLSKGKREKLENKINNFLNTVKQQETITLEEYSKIWESTKYIDTNVNPILNDDMSDDLAIDDPKFQRVIEVVGKFKENPDLLDEIHSVAWKEYAESESIPPSIPDIRDYFFPGDEDTQQKEYEKIIEEYEKEIREYNDFWADKERDVFIKENYPDEVKVLHNFFSTNYDLAEKRKDFISKVINEFEKSQKKITTNTMEQVEFLKNQMKYLGFGESEKLHQDLMKGINSEEAKFNIATTSDRVMTGNKVEFQLHFNKTDKGGIFLNSYEAKLTTKQGEERSHTFKVQKSNNVTAKEAINLLEGRAVKIERTNINEETGEITNDSAFIKLKLREPKTDYNNYKFEMYSKNYGVDVENIMEKSNLVFTNDTQRERVKQNLEKGNVTNVTFQHDKKVIEGFAVLNPQWKMLNLYDEKMNRVNSNKVAQTNELQDNQKNNVREQHISRSL